MHKKSQFSVSREGVLFSNFTFLHHISTRENLKKVTKKHNFSKFYQKLKKKTKNLTFLRFF